MVKKNRENLMDFGWGDTRGVRKVFVESFEDISRIQFFKVADIGYDDEEGNPDLIESLKILTERLTGESYKYVCVTSGCTQAVNAAVSAFLLSGDEVLTRNLYYPRYPYMFSQLGMQAVTEKKADIDSVDVCVVDSPSNPMGEIGEIKDLPENIPVVWDAAYNTPTYGILDKYKQKPRRHDVFCGSLGKLTGINGIRLGWTATNNPDVHALIVRFVKNTTCGVSGFSSLMAIDILNKERHLDLESFFSKSRFLVDSNRVEIQRLANHFGLGSVPHSGMFAFFEIDEKLKRIFEKAEVVFTDGKNCGADFESIRVSLGNTNEATKEMVDQIIKIDRSK